MNIVDYHRLVDRTMTGLPVEPIFTGWRGASGPQMSPAECRVYWRNRCIKALMENADKYGQGALAEAYIEFMEASVHDPYEVWQSYTDILGVVLDFEDFTAEM